MIHKAYFIANRVNKGNRKWWLLAMLLILATLWEWVELDSRWAGRCQKSREWWREEFPGYLQNTAHRGSFGHNTALHSTVFEKCIQFWNVQAECAPHEEHILVLQIVIGPWVNVSGSLSPLARPTVWAGLKRTDIQISPVEPWFSLINLGVLLIFKNTERFFFLRHLFSPLHFPLFLYCRCIISFPLSKNVHSFPGLLSHILFPLLSPCFSLPLVFLPTLLLSSFAL